MRKSVGVLTTACGPVFSRKTGVMIEEFLAYQSAGARVWAFKPKEDNRYELDKRYKIDEVTSLSGLSVPAFVFSNPQEIIEIVDESSNFVLIDEVMFCNEGIIPVIKYLLKKGCDVGTTGLDMDYEGNPFKIMGEVLALSHTIFKRRSRCSVCFEPAMYSHRLVNVKGQVFVGGTDHYAPRCTEHFPPMSNYNG